MTKTKEAERRAMTLTGGGQAPDIFYKDWEKVVNLIKHQF
jgi:hypothetical protein